MSELIFVLGGARSGKSRYSEELVAHIAAGRPVAYIATATAGDSEMADRIARHQAQRPTSWQTIEEPLEVATAIRERSSDFAAVLLDCVTMLVTNILMAAQEERSEPFEARVEREIDALIAAAREAQGVVVLVANELGLGLVPEYPLARLFRDVAGRANQRIAAAADRVVFMVAGIPMVIKPQ